MVERLGYIGGVHGDVFPRRGCAERTQTEGPVRFDEALARQNEEFRRARDEAEVVARLLAAGVVRGVCGEVAGMAPIPAPPMRRECEERHETARVPEAGSDARGRELHGPKLADRPTIASERIERVTRVTAYQTSILKRGGLIDVVV